MSGAGAGAGSAPVDAPSVDVADGDDVDELCSAAAAFGGTIYPMNADGKTATTERHAAATVLSHAKYFQGSPLADIAALIPFGIVLSGTGGRARIYQHTPAIVAAAATPRRDAGLCARVRFPSTVGPARPGTTAGSHPLKAYFSEFISRNLRSQLVVCVPSPRSHG